MGISIWQVGIILLIVVLLFGTKKLRNVGGDLGGALKGFKKAMSDDDTQSPNQTKDADFDAVEDQTKQPTDAQNTQTKQTTSKD